MEWITIIVSGVAVTISSVCASMGYRRTHRVVEPQVHASAAAIDDLRSQQASLLARLSKLEAATERKRRATNGA